MVNSVDYHPSPSRLASRLHSFIFWSLSRMLVEFSLKLSYSTICEKNFEFLEFTFLENALIQSIFTHAPPHSKLALKFMSSRPTQKKITYYPRRHSFENLFRPTAESRGGNYDLFYQNSVKRYKDYLEH